MAAASEKPIQRPSSQPIAVAQPICTSAPGTATPRASASCLGEKWSPTPNISRITPISASWPAAAMSPTKPGVCGPMATPAAR